MRPFAPCTAAMLALACLGCGLEPGGLQSLSQGLASSQACPAASSSPAAPVGGQVRVPLSALDAQATSRLEFAGENAEMGLEGLDGAPLPGAVVRADAQGRFTLPGVPADKAVVVTARVRRADGTEVSLKALVQVGPAGSEVSPSAASTLVVEALAQALATSGAEAKTPAQGARLDASALASLTLIAEAHLKATAPVDWAKPEAVRAAASAAIASNGAFAQALAKVTISLTGGVSVSVGASASATVGGGGGTPVAIPPSPVVALEVGVMVRAKLRTESGESLTLPGLAGMVFGPDGTLYVADPVRHRVMALQPEGEGGFVARVLVGEASGWVDGPVDQARFQDPRDLSFDGQNGLLVVEALGQRLRRIDLSTNPPSVSTLAGDGVAGHADGDAAVSRLDHPIAVAGDPRTGAIILAEGHGQVIRRLSPDGQVDTLAGQALRRGRADGAGLEARFFAPQGLALDEAGRIYVSDSANHAIRLVSFTTDGLSSVATFAGAPPGSAPEGMPGPPAFSDGRGIAAAFSSPQGLAYDAARGHLLVADTGNRRIRAIRLADGEVRTVAGSGLRGTTDGPALVATFDAPSRLAVGPDGLVAIADPGVGRLALLRLE